jgi:GNAT superfamily N-acetyltransferase
LEGCASIASVAVVVRRPDLADVDALARINIDTWRAAYSGIVSRARTEAMEPAAYRRRWVQNVASPGPGVVVLVGEVDGAPAAYAIGGPYRPQEDAAPEHVRGLAELYAIYVDPPKQGVGAGTAVHDALLSRLAGEGFGEVALWVLVANRSARSWYARRGWSADGARSTWAAAGQTLPELRMRRPLFAPQSPDQGE